MSKYRMNEPWGYQENNSYISQKAKVDGERSESKKTDEQQNTEIKAESKAREKADKQLESRIKALENASGGGSSSDIEDKVNELEQAVSTLNGTGEGSVKKTAEDAATAAMNQVVSGAPEMYDTLKEVADYIGSAEEEKTEMKNDISDLESAMSEKADASALDEKADKSELDAKADKSELEGLVNEDALQAAVSGKADSENVYTKAEVDETVAGVEEEISAFSGDVASLNAKDEELQGAIDLKASQSDFEALSGNVYTKEEVENEIATAVSGKASVESVEQIENALDTFATKEDIEGLAPASAITTLESAIEDKAPVSAITELESEIEDKTSASAVTAEIAAAVTLLEASIETKASKEDIEGLASEEYVDEEIGKVVGAAPENFDTLKEFADALAELKVVDQPAVEGEHYTQEECDEYNTSHGLNPGDDGYITTDDWKVEPQTEVSHNMTIGEFVNTAMESVNEKPQVAALEERMVAMENALRRVDANAYQTMMNDLEVLDTLKDSNSVTISEGTVGDIVIPETTKSKTINAELEQDASLTLNSRYSVTINNSGTEETDLKVTAPAVDGYNAATVTLNGGKYDTITVTDASLTVNTGATLQNVVITEDTTKALTINANFASGATVTSNSSAPITLTNKNASGEEVSITLTAPNSTVTFTGGQWEVVNAEVSDDTLIINKAAHIDTLNVAKGNVIVKVARQSDIATVVENYNLASGCTIDYLKDDITNENQSILTGTGEHTLVEDISHKGNFSVGTFSSDYIVWMLNNHTITINNTRDIAGFLVRGTATLEINGDGNYIVPDDYGVWVRVNSGSATGAIINGGNFEGNTHVLYAEKGVIEVNGGTFKLTNPDECDKDVNGNFKFLLNCLDANYQNGTAKIIVRGGKFYGFNPAETYGEPGGPVSYVAQGYHVVESVEDGMKVYEVVED